MKAGMLWKVSVTTSPSAEEAVAEYLGTVSGEPAASYADADTREVTVSVYIPGSPHWLASARRKLTLGLERMAHAGLDTGPGRIRLERVQSEDWAECWKQHFKPLVIGSALLVKPSWSRCSPQRGQAMVVLDPGLSFGTGHHPTTAFCLQQLVACRRRDDAQSCLDVGSGSGILAIAAAKLGYHPVNALDCDPEALRIGRTNARRNGVSAAIRFFQRDLATLPSQSARKYSLVCANLLSNLLIAERERLLSRLQPNGALIVAGILKSEFGKLRQSFESAGLRLTTSRARNEWHSGTFAWR